jgi:archaellum component FlaC
MDSETAAEIKRHFNVVAKGLRADIRVVIEGLAANTDRLERVETRLDRVDVRLDRIEVRLDGMDVRLDGMDVRLNEMQTEIGGLKAMIRPFLTRSDA